MIKIVHFIECLPCYGGTPQKLLYLTKYSDKYVRNIFLCYQPSEMKSQFIENEAIVNEINSLSFIECNTPVVASPIIPNNCKSN